MKKEINMISLFNGMGCAEQAAKKLMKPKICVASEIDKYALTVSQKNFPKTIQVGDVVNLRTKELKKIFKGEEVFIIVGGSPCKNFSVAGKKEGMITEESLEILTLKQYLKYKNDGYKFKGQSYLFWEFVRIVNEIKPKYFILENVVMDKYWSDVITKELKVEPIKINSKLFTAQNRERLYWTNIPNIKPPKDKQVYITDVIPGTIGGCGLHGKKFPGDSKYTQVMVVRKDKKTNCITTTSNTRQVKFKNGVIRYLTPEECEVLQGLPIGYSNYVSKTQRLKMLGNGMTVDVIEYIMKHIPELKYHK